MRALVEPIVTGLAAALIWAIGAWILRGVRRRYYFAKLAGSFKVEPKLPDQSDLGSAQAVTVTVRQTVLKLVFYDLHAEGTLVGEVQMSEAFPRSGIGFYQHLKNGQHLWGHLHLQVASKDEIFVHHSYTRKDRVLVTQGFRWHRA